MPTWLECFIDKLLEKDRNDRFASAEEVVAVLSRELAALQNPRTQPPPSRPWMRRRSLIRPAFDRRLALALAAAAVAIAAVVWWPDKPATLDTGSATVPQAHNSPPLSHVPLWNVDGTSDLRTRTNQFEAELFAPAASSFDPWSNDTQLLRQRLMEMSRSNF